MTNRTFVVYALDSLAIDPRICDQQRTSPPSLPHRSRASFRRPQLRVLAARIEQALDVMARLVGQRLLLLALLRHVDRP
jgi:hypothetical protein